jgi:hypothetical protein
MAEDQASAEADLFVDRFLLINIWGRRPPWRIRRARHWCSVRYVIFDLLYHAGRCLVHEPLARRRRSLIEPARSPWRK